jgi:hypothetical protein
VADDATGTDFTVQRTFPVWAAEDSSRRLDPLVGRTTSLEFGSKLYHTSLLASGRQQFVAEATLFFLRAVARTQIKTELTILLNDFSLDDGGNVRS